MPLKSRGAVAIGEFDGPYHYRPDLPPDVRHTRPVKWLRMDVPRSAFGQDLVYSMGSLLTVSQVRRNDAEARVRAMASGGPDRRLSLPKLSTSAAAHDADLPEVGDEMLDVAQSARDQIIGYLSSRFRGHELARLVDGVLKAQGYQTQLSPPGPDGGIDILAGTGPMGFDRPRLCVQIKSSDSPVDVGVLQQLQGVVQSSGADQGLLVAWGGYKDTVVRESRRLFFKVRLWDQAELLTALLESYENLSEELRAELPLQRIWALVPEEA